MVLKILLLNTYLLIQYIIDSTCSSFILNTIDMDMDIKYILYY